MSGNKKRGSAAVNAVRYLAIVFAAAFFGVYAFSHESDLEWYDLIAPLVTLALFTGVFIAAAPRLVRLVSGEGDFSPAEARGTRRLRSFFLIMLGALILHAALYLLGVFFLSVYWGEGDILTRMGSNMRIAWMKNNTDAKHYLSIAENWYLTTGDERLFIVFFPMFPLLIRCANLIFGDSYLSATVINAIAVMLTAGMIYLTFEPIMGDRRAKCGAFLSMLLPGAIFMNSPMTEPLFMLFTVCGFFFLQKRNYILAGLFTACAGFTRSLGVLLAVPMLLVGIGHIVSLKKQKQPAGETVFALILGLILSTAGTVAYLAVNYAVHGDAFKFLEYQYENWSQEASPFIDTPRYMIQRIGMDYLRYPINVISLWVPQLIAIFASLILMLSKAKKLPFSYTAYFLCYFAVSIGCTWLLSGVRYLCAAIPVVAALALVCDKKWKAWTVFTLTALCYIVYLAMYMRQMQIY